MKAWKNYWVWIVAVFLVGLFWWLRFNNIGTSLFYFNDMGRDLLVLQDWMETGKPPLLGPQTSSLPINQSAIYFYLLMPGFLLFNGSPMALLYTNAFIYISFFLGGLWFLRGNKKMQMALLGFFLLVTISPQYIIQSRFVWNPSFTTPLLATALISFYLLTQKFSQKLMIVFVATLAIAISFSYSMAPAFIGIYIFGFTTLLFLCIASLPRWPKILVLLVLSSFYLTPSRLSAYFKPAIRTYEQMTQCFDTVCKEIKEPIFESVQAGFHPYHNGPEHRVMMKQAGCQVKYIENEPSSASLMAVVLDNSTFELGKTSYKELTLFGKAKEIKRYNCQENFQVVVLEKDQAMKYPRVKKITERMDIKIQ